jgi:hypothetical protein
MVRGKATKMMRTEPVEIAWHPSLPIFSSERFLKSVSDEYGWLGGIDEQGKIRCVLPYTIIHKAMFRMARFRTETILLSQFDVQDERSFLSGAMDYFRSRNIDLVIPATTNAVFRTYPAGADAAPYGSYILDLSQPEDSLWKNVAKISRQNIGTAKRSGVTIRAGSEFIDISYDLVKDTFKRSKLPFMSRNSYRRYVAGLGEYGNVMVAEYQGSVQSSTVYGFSEYCAYAIYAGNLPEAHQGTMKLLQWEAICLFKKLGIKWFDFVGARIEPEKGSKQEAINSFKRRFGATLKQGYIWKYPIRPLKYRLYWLAAQLRSGGDIVDSEKHKLLNYERSKVD